MTEIPTSEFVSESAEDLIKRAEQILQGTPAPYPQHLSSHLLMQDQPEIRSLSPSCYRIEVKNVINDVDKSIVICTGSTPGDCPTTIPTTCPTGVNPSDYVNMLAIVNALTAQTGVTIRFEYLLDDVPPYTDVVANLTAGDNTIYAFTTNVQYSAGQTLTLYDVKVIE
jgi:hypothetical protein